MRLSTHTFAGMANALTRKEPPHEDQPELMTRAERRRAARKARAVKTWKKVAAGTVAVATLFGGMGVASTALAADRDSYQTPSEILLSSRPVTSTVWPST